MLKEDQVPGDGYIPDIKEMDITPAIKLTTTGKECSRRKTQYAHHTIILLRPVKACEGLLCLAMTIQTLRGTVMYSLVNEVCCLMIP